MGRRGRIFIWTRVRRRVADVARAAMSRAGFAVTRAHVGPELVTLCRRLRPVATEHPLIRLGGEGDGGYLVPDDLVGVTRCFSPGVADVADFELSLAQRGIPCHLADASIAEAPLAHDLIHFEPIFLGAIDDGVTRTLATWVEAVASPGETDLLLQMDIEGAEVATLLSTPRNVLQRFRIIVFELHGLEGVHTTVGQATIGAMLDKLGQDFVLVHAHPNNGAPIHAIGSISVPGLIELTYLRRDRVAEQRGPAVVPHPLDRRCVAMLPEVTLADSLSYPGSRREQAA